jgi:hypothetical protein
VERKQNREGKTDLSEGSLVAEIVKATNAILARVKVVELNECEAGNRVSSKNTPRKYHV